MWNIFKQCNKARNQKVQKGIKTVIYKEEYLYFEFEYLKYLNLNILT